MISFRIAEISPPVLRSITVSVPASMETSSFLQLLLQIAMVRRGSKICIDLDPETFSNPDGFNPFMVSIDRNDNPARGNFFPQPFRGNSFFDGHLSISFVMMPF